MAMSLDGPGLTVASAERAAFENLHHTSSIQHPAPSTQHPASSAAASTSKAYALDLHEGALSFNAVARRPT